MSISEANAKAVEIIQNSKPVLLGVGQAGEVLPDYQGKTILHAAPPVDWQDMAGPMKGAVVGALIYEGWADSEKEALSLADSGEIKFEPAHHHQAVGPMTGIVSPSMPVWIVENEEYGNRACCTINEGLGKVLRFGANSPEVIEKLHWIEERLAPVLQQTLEISGPINLRNITAQALHMGDEVHNRNKAATALFLREIAGDLVRSRSRSEGGDEDNGDIDLPGSGPGSPAGIATGSDEEIAKIFEFIAGNEHFYLNLSMAASKATMDAAHGIEECTVITALARNGVEFGIRVSGLGDRWFTGPAQKIDGLFFPGYSKEDACRDIGDSTISETAGVGGFAMAAAPAIVGFVGGTVQDAVKYTRDMYEITLAENENYTIPYLGFRGTGTAIDLRKVVETGILPAINTGIAHKDPGVGQIGAGLVDPPREAFVSALKAFAEKYKKQQNGSDS